MVSEYSGFSAGKPGQLIQPFTMLPCVCEMEVSSGLNVTKC